MTMNKQEDIMSPNEQLDILMERLKEKDRDLALEIQLVTAWIEEHRETRPVHTETPSSTSREWEEYRSWRIVSCRLHQRRSELKTKQEKNQSHLRAVACKIEAPGTGFSSFPVFADMTLESELASAGA
jgi:hypothetical protein